MGCPDILIFGRLPTLMVNEFAESARYVASYTLPGIDATDVASAYVIKILRAKCVLC